MIRMTIKHSLDAKVNKRICIKLYIYIYILLPRINKCTYTYFQCGPHIDVKSMRIHYFSNKAQPVLLYLSETLSFE